jgi:hypothetical protein
MGGIGVQKMPRYEPPPLKIIKLISVVSEKITAHRLG